MIETIEKYRLENRMSKAETARILGVTIQMYYKYLKGTKLHFDIVERFFNKIGYEIQFVKVLNRVK